MLGVHQQDDRKQFDDFTSDGRDASGKSLAQKRRAQFRASVPPSIEIDRGGRLIAGENHAYFGIADIDHVGLSREVAAPASLAMN